MGVGEIWGNYFGFICKNDYFGWAGFDLEENWFNPSILRRLDDNYGFTSSQIFNCLTSDVKSHDKLKTKLKDSYGRTTQVNEAFSFYGF